MGKINRNDEDECVFVRMYSDDGQIREHLTIKKIEHLEYCSRKYRKAARIFYIGAFVFLGLFFYNTSLIVRDFDSMDLSEKISQIYVDIMITLGGCLAIRDGERCKVASKSRKQIAQSERAYRNAHPEEFIDEQEESIIKK